MSDDSYVFEGPAEAPAARDNNPPLSISELSFALKRTLEERFGHVRLRGEVSKVNRHASGHVYLTLKDDKSAIDGVIWKGSVRGLGVQPEAGLEVIVTGKITSYPARSSYQIVIESMEAAGAGALLAQLERLKVKLRDEGLFEPGRKKPLPAFPATIGVITSPTGAVIRDVLHRIAERWPCRVIVWPVVVQGEAACGQVSNAIRGFDAMRSDGPIPRPDLLIVARGGGSVEDLWCFNDESLARTVAAARIPIISAVGHEIDWTLIDHDADVRAPTPTGAAEMAVPVRAELLAQLASHNARLSGAVSRRLDQERKGLAALARAMPGIDALLEQPRRRLDEATTGLAGNLRHAVGEKRRLFAGASARLVPATLDAALRDKRATLRHHAVHADHGMRVRLDAARRRFDRVAADLKPHTLKARSEAARLSLVQLSERLERTEALERTRRRQRVENVWRLASSLSPLNVLERGYAIVRDETEHALTRADQLSAGMAVTLEFAGRQRRGAVVTDGEASPSPRSAGPASGDLGPGGTDPAGSKPAPAKPRKPRTKPVAEGQGSLF